MRGGKRRSDNQETHGPIFYLALTTKEIRMHCCADYLILNLTNAGEGGSFLSFAKQSPGEKYANFPQNTLHIRTFFFQCIAEIKKKQVDFFVCENDGETAHLERENTD